MDKNKKYRLIQYEKSMPNELTVKEKLLKSKELGYDGIELSIDETDEKLARLDWNEEEILDLVTFMAKENYRIHSICLSALRRFCFGSHDLENREQSLVVLEKAISLAYRLGVRYIQIPGYDVYYEKSDDMTVRLFEENLKRGVSIAAKYGVVLGFETMEPEFMNNVKKAMHYVDIVNSPYLGVYPDSGNCTAAAIKYNENIADDYKVGRGHIIACHLKEIKDGQFRKIQFGQGENDFELTVRTMAEMGVSIFTTEYWAFDETWESRCHFAVKYFKNLLDKVFD